ncbi:hypothetical protein [Listeria newyorkensis]|uniref:Uncharacterized protein n=1 Tax=Listeria newyorkensis TaxID=1497681 RepID=A0A841YUP4_9LIST|nr:hypothetical protein [Listeria newyorkensis]MBC1457120.1 hypothetical protein [Listeria newyorkensis]
MDKLTQMNKEILEENLLKTIDEIKEEASISFEECRFIIEPVLEKDKPLTSEDNFMRLNIFSEENIGNKKISLKQTIGVLGGLEPLVPIWINVSFLEMDGDVAVFKLESSLRFRKPTLLRNVDTGHAPFKVAK